MLEWYYLVVAARRLLLLENCVALTLSGAAFLCGWRHEVARRGGALPWYAFSYAVEQIVVPVGVCCLRNAFSTHSRARHRAGGGLDAHSSFHAAFARGDQLEFCLLLFVSRRAPFDLLIELFRRVFLMENGVELIPEWLECSRRQVDLDVGVETWTPCSGRVMSLRTPYL